MTAFEKYWSQINIPNTIDGLKFKEAAAEIWNAALTAAQSLAYDSNHAIYKHKIIHSSDIEQLRVGQNEI